MKKTALLLITFIMVTVVASYGQHVNAYIDLVASNHKITGSPNIVTTPRDGTINVENIDAYLELRKGLDKSISNTMKYKKNTDIGLTNEEVGRMIVIHPNPVIDRFRIKVPAEIGEVTSAGIHNMDGSWVRRFGSKIGNWKDREVELDATDLKPGLYFIRIENEAGMISRSFEIREP